MTDALIGFGVIFALALLRVPLAFAMGFVGYVGLGLLRGAVRHLAPGGKLVTYGPYFEADVPSAPSNVAFDQSLREHDASWGIRLREDVEQAAAHAGLQLAARHAMPANNLLLVWTPAA